MTARLPWALLLIATAATPAFAQVRDAARSTAGSATIAGTVVTDSEPARPVRRVTVSVTSQDPPVQRAAITDDAGRFLIANLPAGRYTVGGTKRGWVPAQYGAKAIGRPGRSVQLAQGQRADVAIRMARGAVITGTILDQSGQPFTGVTLRVMRYAFAFNTGERRLGPTASTVVGPDERGSYRIYGLAPGEYYVSATSQSSFLSGGRALHLTTEVDVQEAIKAAQGGPASPMADVPQRNVGISQTFYPGTTSAAQATAVVVRAGEERSGIDFTLQYAPVARVQGTVSTASGTLPQATRVMLVLNDPNSTVTGIEAMKSATVRPDGTFEFAEVAPGPYTLSAHGTIPQPAGTPGPAQVLAAATDVDVQSADIAGLSMMLQEGLTVTGAVRYEGSAPGPNLTAVRVNLTPAQATGIVTISTASTATTTPDGRFALSGVSPGRYRFNVVVPPPGPWPIQSATLLGQNALDGFVEIRQSVTDATVTLTDQIAELRGKVEAAAGASSDYTMVLFSSDRAHWISQSRRTLTARTAVDGSFVFRNVPPGEYQLAAVDDVEPGEWNDPAFLSRLAPAATKITIAEGEKKVHDIRVGGG